MAYRRRQHIGADEETSLLNNETIVVETKKKVNCLYVWLSLGCVVFVLFLFLLLWALVKTNPGETITVEGLNQTAVMQTLIDAFARTITQQDWHGNANLFVAGGLSTVDFQRAMTFLSGGPVLVVDGTPVVAPVGSWRHQLEVFSGGLSSNHLMLTNCNMSFWQPPLANPFRAIATCVASYSYTLVYSLSVNTSLLPTQLVAFQAQFEAQRSAFGMAPHFSGWQLTRALALPNATSTLLSTVDTGVSPPGAVLRKRDLSDSFVVWNTLQDQVVSLVSVNQISTAIAVCKTDQYIDLAALYDPYGNTTLCPNLVSPPVFLENTIVCSNGGSIDASCISDEDGTMDRIKTINSIFPIPSIPPLPNSLDFTITGGFGIAIQGNMHGIVIHNVGLTAIPLLGTPELDFQITTLPIPTLQVIKLNQSANTVWAGPISGPDDIPVFRLLVLADLPLIDLATHVTGVLPLSNGGTGNAGPFLGNRIILSNVGGTQLVESPLLGNGNFLVQDESGNLVPGTVTGGPGINVSFVSGIYTVTSLDAATVVQVDLVVPTDIFQVTSMSIVDNGTLTFVAIPQVAHSVWIGPVSGGPAVPSFRVLQEVDLPVISLTGTRVGGILPVSRGGTNNNGGTWTGERVIMSDAGGTTLTEGTVTGTGGIAISYGTGPTLVISGTGGTCVANDTISQTCLDISAMPCPGGALDATCIPSTLTLAALTVTGPSSLGTSTTCAAPLSAPCYDISGQSCPGGYLNVNCVNPDLILNSLTINSIVANSFTLLNGTIAMGGLSSFDAINTTTLYATAIVLSGPMTCSPEDTISHSCYDISGISCTTPISSNCFPINITLADLSVTNELEVNIVTCLGTPLGNDCIPSRVRTINGINPSAAPALDFTITTSGAGISVTPTVNGLVLANTGVTSVGLSLPLSLFSITVPSVTTTGTLTAVLETQAANTFFAAPDGIAGQPTFRTIEFSDLPTGPGGPNSLYYVDGSGNLTSAALSLALTMPVSEFSVIGSPITSPSGTFSVAKANQVAHSVWIGPLSGPAAQPTFRTLALSDLAPLGLTTGQVLTGITAGDPVGKTLIAGTNMVITELAGSFVFDSTSLDAISNITVTVPSYLTVTPATLTTSGTFDITANAQSANRFLGGPTSGGAAVPTFRALENADLPSLADGQFFIGVTGGAPVSSQLTAGSLITITPGPGTSTVSTTALGMVTLDMPTAVFDVASASGLNTQTFTVTFDTQLANNVFAGPSSGGAMIPSFRSLVALDIPNLDTSKITTGILPIARGGTNSGTALNNNRIMISSGGAIVERAAMTNGQILIGSTGNAPVAALLVGTGNRILVSGGPGSITISSPQDTHTAATPTFASETLTATTNQLRLGTTNTATISATAPAASRTYTIADPGANANFVMDTAGALTITNAGSVGQVLTLASATTATWQTEIGTGTVTSVGLSLPVSVFSISGSPVTTSGTLTGTFNTQTANTFFAGPPNGGAATPTFRAITTADLPVAILLSYSEATSATNILAFSTGSYTTVTSMTLTPAAGTYWCSFSTTVIPSTSSGQYDVALHLNGVIVPHTLRSATGSSSYFNIHTLAVIVTPGSQTIDVRWQKSGGSGSADMRARSLYCLRIA